VVNQRKVVCSCLSCFWLLNFTSAAFSESEINILYRRNNFKVTSKFLINSDITISLRFLQQELTASGATLSPINQKQFFHQNSILKIHYAINAGTVFDSCEHFFVHPLKYELFFLALYLHSVLLFNIKSSCNYSYCNGIT
jgi:hypothetical protein